MTLAKLKLAVNQSKSFKIIQPMKISNITTVLTAASGYSNVKV